MYSIILNMLGCIFVLSLMNIVTATYTKEQVTEILNKFLIDYDPRLRPGFGGDPLQVNVTLHVDSIGPISEVDMSFRVDFAFRQYWQDDRLSYGEEDDDPLALSYEFLNKIWLPDTYFPESLDAQKHDVMTPNILLRLHPDGKILYSARVTVIGKCPMDLRYFPMDKQSCSLIIECYGYTAKDLLLRWEPANEQPVVIASNLQLAQFSVEKPHLKNYTLSFSTGNFSDLEVQFIFQRSLVYFLLQSYMPATLIVMLSWVSFWVNRNSVPARASLSITTVLTMITLIGATNASLPKVSDVKAIDVYFGMCFIYVFGALIEFSAVCYFNKPNSETEKVEHPRSNTAGGPGVIFDEYEFQELTPTLPGVYTPRPHPDDEDNLVLEVGNHKACQKAIMHEQARQRQLELTHKSKAAKKNKASLDVVKNMDLYSRIMFPITYMILNAVYWITYYKLTRSSEIP